MDAVRADYDQQLDARVPTAKSRSIGGASRGIRER
jgi:hypothetical protein